MDDTAAEILVDRVPRELHAAKRVAGTTWRDSARYSIFSLDLDHRIVSWSDSARRNYGYEAAEIVGKGSSSETLFLPVDVTSGAVARLLADAYQHGMSEGEFERVRNDGTRFFASVVVIRRDTADGQPLGYLFMSSDISEQKRAAGDLRSAWQYSRGLIEASLDPLVTLSPEGNITDLNEATIKVTGSSRESLLGTDFSDYFTEPERARATYQEVFSKGFVTDYPLTIRHREGAHTHVLYKSSLYKDVRGNVLGVFASARDVTALKRAEAEVAYQREKELERLAELERFQKLTVGRELKMIELKREIAELKKEIPTDKLER